MAIVAGKTYSKTGTRSGGNSYSLIAGIDYLVVSQDTTNNTSLLRIRPWIQRPSSNTGAYNLSTATLQVKADGTQKTTVFTYDFRSTTANKKYYVTSSMPFKRSSGASDPYDFTITHNNDGSKTANIYACFPLESGGSTGNFTVNFSIELPKIPRGSVIGTITTYNVEEDIILPITKYLDNYYDVLQIYNSDKTALLATVDNVENGDTINLLTLLGADLLYTTMTTKFYKFIFVINTYSDSSKTTLVGTNQKDTAGYLASDTSSPLFVDFDIEDSNDTTYALTNNRSTFIKGYSTLKISNLNAEAQKKATIAYWIVNDNAIANTGSNVIKIENYNTNSITVYAQDSRGMSTGLTKTITNFIEYFKLTKGVQNIERVDDITEQVKISFEGDVWDGNFGAVSNALNVTYQYKETKDSTWIDGASTITPTVQNNKYSFNGLILGDTNNGFNIGNSYDIKVTVKDKLSQVEFIYQIQSGKPAIALYGNKVALGDKFDEDDTVHNVQLWGSATYNGDEVFTDYITEQNTSGIWAYRKWNSGISECWSTSYIASGTHTMSKNGNIFASSTHEYQFPSNLFIDTPIISANVQQGGGMWAKATGSTTSEKAVIGFLRSNDDTSSINFNMIVKGRWK